MLYDKYFCKLNTHINSWRYNGHMKYGVSVGLYLLILFCGMLTSIYALDEYDRKIIRDIEGYEIEDEREKAKKEKRGETTGSKEQEKKKEGANSSSSNKWKCARKYLLALRDSHERKDNSQNEESFNLH